MTIDGNTLYKLRKIYRLSQLEMGEILDVSDSLITKIEKGSRRMSDQVTQRLVQRFDLTPEKLVSTLSIYEQYTVER